MTGWILMLGKWSWKLQLWVRECPQKYNTHTHTCHIHRNAQFHGTISKNIREKVFSFSMVWLLGTDLERLNHITMLSWSAEKVHSSLAATAEAKVHLGKTLIPITCKMSGVLLKDILKKSCLTFRQTWDFITKICFCSSKLYVLFHVFNIL